MAPLTPATKTPSTRTPSIVHAVSAALLVTLLALLLVAAPRSAPPAIAQIAPNAVQQIKEAPQEQALDAEGDDEGTEGTEGEGGGAGDGTGEGEDAEDGADGVGATLGPTPDVLASGGLEEPRQKSCVGKPVPQQIEDPQSPPCAPFFEGDNGGATARGVTASTIKVALPDKNVNTPYLTALVAFFNQRFQFYGRSLEVAQIPNYEPSGACDPSRQTTAAATAVDELNAFISFDTSDCGGLFYSREAAARELLVTNYQPLYDEQELRKLDPWVWSYPMSNDRLFPALGKWTCQRLVGAPARFAQDPTLVAKSRKFGVLLAEPVRPQKTDFEPLLNALRACGAPVDEQDVRRIQLNSANDAPEAIARDVVLRWKQSGVTSVIVLSHAEFTTQTLFPAASAGGLLPEWIMPDYWEQDTLAIQHQRPSAQQAAMMGITVKPPHHRLEDDPAVQAVRSIDPTLLAPADADVSVARQIWITRMYKQLLLMATGIQGAGPNLTPERFARAMETTVFPNPPSRLNEGRVGFPSSHSATLDFSEVYYSTTKRGAFRSEPPGAWCYVDGGKRRTALDIPKGDAPFFKEPCQAAIG